ncbi:unnamed protein product [Brassica rapa subsp. trilocularis]
MFGFAVGLLTDYKVCDRLRPCRQWLFSSPFPVSFCGQCYLLHHWSKGYRLKLLDTLRAAGAIRSSPDEHDDAADENSYGGGYNNGGLTILDEHQAQFGGDGLISGGVGQVGDDDGFSISFD